jgi:hypothetical protein
MDLFSLHVVIITLLGLIIVGYFRSSLQKTKPNSLIDIQKVSDLWLTDSSWSAKLSVLALPFLVAYNLLVWLVYGVTSLFDFLAYLFSFLWVFVRLVWVEVLHPSVFWYAKLIWHYPVGFSWRFFQLAMTHVPAAYTKSNLTQSFKYLFMFGLIGALMTTIYRLQPNVVSLTLGIVVVVVMFQFTVLRVLAALKPAFKPDEVLPTLKTSLAWLFISLLYAAVLISQTALDSFSLSAAMVSVTQVMVPIGLAFFLSFMTAITCLAPYSRSVNQINMGAYLKEVFYRIPKLLFAQPLQLVGILIVGLVPLLFMIGINQGIHSFTGRGIPAWWNETKNMDTLFPNWKDATKGIHENDNQIRNINGQIATATTIHNERVAATDQRIQQTTLLIESIPKDQIHTFSGDAYVGERQYFSVPHISQCSDYTFQIRKDGRVMMEQTLKAQPDLGSIIVSYVWNETGRYRISLVAKNRCGSYQDSQVVVDVVTMPTPLRTISRPVGNTFVCENEEAVYRTQAGYDQYEWRHPYGTSTTQTEVLRLRWGAISGTVQVRGVNRDGVKSLWSGTTVQVQPLPGNAESSSQLLDDESPIPIQIDRDFVFVTKEEGQDSLASLMQAKERITETYNAEVGILNATLDELNADNTSLKSLRWAEANLFLGRFLALIGIALFMAILLSTVFTHFVLFQYDLFEFKQDGQHYISETIQAMKERNPNQPLLGAFILSIAAALAYFVYIVAIAASHHVDPATVIP